MLPDLGGKETLDNFCNLVSMKIGPVSNAEFLALSQN